jgi:hypothetical protein
MADIADEATDGCPAISGLAPAERRRISDLHFKNKMAARISRGHLEM